MAEGAKPAGRSRSRVSLLVAVVVASAVGAALLVRGCGKRSPEVPLGAASAERSDHEFALELYRQLANRSVHRNIFCSPYSVTSAMAVPYTGAGGNTATQMTRALRSPGDPAEQLSRYVTLKHALGVGGKSEKGSPELGVADATWVQKGFRVLPAFEQLLKTSGAEAVRTEDFRGDPAGAAGRINAWVSEKTGGKIPAMIGSGEMGEATRMVVASAIYFKAGWKTTFAPIMTRPLPFVTSTRERIEVPTMWQKEWYRLVERNDMEMLDLPYVGERLSMVIFLPRSERGLPELEQRMVSGALGKWLKAVDAEEKSEAVVFLPRFEMATRYDLRKALTAMGMPDAFDPAKADFTGISGEQLFLGKVLHRAYVRVDEMGTEATAATMPFIIADDDDEPDLFRADHPFVFLIRDKRTGSILFMGRVTDPRGDR
jgi:serpin B